MADNSLVDALLDNLWSTDSPNSFDESAFTTISQSQTSEVPWTPVATNSSRSPDPGGDRSFQEDLEVRSQNSHSIARRQARAPLSTQRRRAQNREAQRIFRLRAASHLKAVEDELADLKRKHGALLQRYHELQYWGNGLLSTLLKGYSSHVGYDAGVTQPRVGGEQNKAASKEYTLDENY